MVSPVQAPGTPYTQSPAELHLQSGLFGWTDIAAAATSTLLANELHGA